MMTKIKVNDKVAVIAGKERGKSGKVLQILPDLDKVVVEGANVMYKHLRPKKTGEKGQRVQFNGPVDLSNVMLICPKCNKNTRVGFKVSTSSSDVKTKSKVRFCKKCKEVIE